MPEGNVTKGWGAGIMANIRDRLWEKAGKEGFPLTAAFELLPVCNLSCKMCYVRKSMKEVQQEGGLKDGKWWLEKAKEASSYGLLFPLLTGGEPFLHPDFRQILTGMQDMGMQVSINSNATLIDRETAKWLGNHVPNRINITLYGASEKTYENLCGDGNAYKKVCDAVQWLKEYQVPVKFNTSITPQNVQDLEEMIRFAKKVESPIQAAYYMFPPVRRNQDMIGQNDRLTPEEAGLARVKADFLQGEPEWFVGMAKRFSYFVPLEKCNLQPDENVKMKMSCRAGHCSFWLDWQGNMRNCGMYSSVTLSTENRDFGEVWKELREQTHKVRYAPVCAVCPNQPLCHSCIAMVANECGDINGKPEYLCRMNQAAAKYYQEYLKKILEEFKVRETLSTGEEVPQNCGLDEF